MTEPSVNINCELEVVETELRCIEAEYNMFFAGQLRRPLLEARGHVDVLVNGLNRMRLLNYRDHVCLIMLQARFAMFIYLLDRGLRAREEGRAGPFAQLRKMAEKASQILSCTITVATFQ